MEIKEYCENCKEFRKLNIKEKSNAKSVSGEIKISLNKRN